MCSRWEHEVQCFMWGDGRVPRAKPTGATILVLIRNREGRQAHLAAEGARPGARAVEDFNLCDSGCWLFLSLGLVIQEEGADADME